MGWPFKHKNIVNAEDEAWHLDDWRWMLERWGGLADLKKSPFVTPTSEFFPASGVKGEEKVAFAFDRVKTHAKMQGWSCRLVAQPRRADRLSTFVPLTREKSGAAGTFSWNESEAVITYDPALADDPLALVATLIHELAHYRLAGQGLPPGGKEMEEFATDLATVYLGFGVFGANTAFRMQQHGDYLSQGWKRSGLGYLRREDWLFGLAVFFALREEPVELARKFLPSEMFASLRKAARYLETRPDAIAELRAVRGRKEAEAPSQESA
jgi:hypothetical protein